MSAWLRQHRQAFLLGVRKLSLLNALVIAIALSLPAAGYALLESLRPAGERLALEPRIALFLAPQAQRADADALGARLRADRRIASVRFVPREEALKEMSSVQGLAEVIGALGRNPLPDAFVVTSKEDIAGELASLPGVTHVQADAIWARRLAAAAAIAQLGIAVLAALLGAALVAVTFNTIRLQILTQRDEIEVSKLLGATDAFIGRPFYYLGLLQGLVGGVLALAIVAAALGLLNREVRVLAESYGSNFRFGFLPLSEALLVLLLAAALGWLGAWLSVGRHLRAIEPR
jgi:cell division transport system permease protein